MTAAPKAAPAATETTDVQDVQLLADEIVTLCHDTRFNDMTWREIEAACELAVHQVKLVFSQHGSLDAAPAPPAR